MILPVYITLIAVQVVGGVWLFVRGLRGGTGLPAFGGFGDDLTGALGSAALCL